MVSKKVLLFFISFIHGCEGVDINTASLEELDEIKWVGPTTAKNIINARPFSSIEDLINISRITEERLEEIKEQGLACVGESEPLVAPSEEPQNSSQEETPNDSEEENAKEDIEIIQNKSPDEEKKSKVLDTINLNSKKNSEGLSKSDYALYGLGIFALIIIILFLINKFRYKNEFR